MSDPVPENIPDELIEIGANAIRAARMSWQHDGPTREERRADAQAVLAVVLPVVRQQIADKIWREVNPHQASVHQAIDACARVVRGDP